MNKKKSVISMVLNFDLIEFLPSVTSLLSCRFLYMRVVTHFFIYFIHFNYLFLSFCVEPAVCAGTRTWLCALIACLMRKLYACMLMGLTLHLRAVVDRLCLFGGSI